MMKTNVVGGVQPSLESDDESDEYAATSYTEREMGMSSKVAHKPFQGTYDIFENVDFFKSPAEVVLENSEKFMALDQDEEALE
jgi:hypothetical protein